MPTIDREFLLKHLDPDNRGQRAALARAMGIEQSKLSKILAGTRRIQADEVAAILDFFDLTLEGGAPRPASATSSAGFSESEAEIYDPTPTGKAAIDALANLGTRPRHSQTYQLRRDFAGFALLRGDVLLIDMGAAPGQGDIVLATVSDPEADRHATVVRRYLEGWLIDESISTAPMQISDDQRVGIVGVVRGSLRR